MAKKTLGAVQLGWRCPNCRTLNPGPQQTCSSCGNPQPENVAFENMPQQELLTDADSLAKARQAADIHCPYCGTRNPADAKSCRQCSGDLVGGAQRKKGQVVGAFKTGAAEKIPCPSCGTLNLPNVQRCSSCAADLAAAQSPEEASQPSKPSPSILKRSPILLVGLGLLLLAGCIALIFFLTRTKQLTGTVSGYAWSRTVNIEQFKPVQNSDWREDIPPEATLGACEQRLNRTQDQPEGNYKEVCGTPYTIDSGTGMGEVVQDCQYEIYLDYCEYTIMDWAIVETLKQTGNDQNPYWPDQQMAADQRQGARTENYTVFFDTSEGALEYSTTDVAYFQSFSSGSFWNLEVNAFGAINQVLPK